MILKSRRRQLNYQLDLKSQQIKKARGSTPEDFPNTFIFPTFNVVRYWNDNKTALGGFALGFLPQGVGASYYTTFEFWESLTVVAAVEAVEYRGDFAIFDQFLGGAAYELEGGGISAGFRFGFLYQF